LQVDPEAILESLGSARKFADPQAPKPARLMAAGGTLPLPPAEICTVLFALTLDPDPEVEAKAQQSLGELPEGVLDSALAAPLHAAVLGFFAERFQDDGTRMEKIALNAATADETYCFLAELPHVSVVEIVSHNQTRLLRCEKLVEALSENPVTGQSTINRVLEFLGLAGREFESERDAGVEVPEPLPDTAQLDATIHDLEDVSAFPDELIEDDEALLDEAEDEPSDSSARLATLIQKMTVMEKIKLARFGNSEARGLLARDRNKMIASAAVKSPKITENEIINFAKSRSLCDEVYRVIAMTPEWTKNYQVKLAISMNPKSQLPTAIKFLNYLTDRDLKQIMHSRDVPGQISAQARRILSRKGKV
jgi:uncharacterized coiled-coil protein SlyX